MNYAAMRSRAHVFSFSRFLFYREAICKLEKFRAPLDRESLWDSGEISISFTHHLGAPLLSLVGK